MAFLFAEVYRRGVEWRLRAVGQGYASGLAGFAQDFGVAVAEEEEPARAVPPGPPVVPGPPVLPAPAAPAPAWPGAPAAPAAPAPVDLRKRGRLVNMEMRVA